MKSLRAAPLMQARWSGVLLLSPVLPLLTFIALFANIIYTMLNCPSTTAWCKLLMISRRGSVSRNLAHYMESASNGSVFPVSPLQDMFDIISLLDVDSNY